MAFAVSTVQDDFQEGEMISLNSFSPVNPHLNYNHSCHLVMGTKTDTPGLQYGPKKIMMIDSRMGTMLTTCSIEVRVCD